MHYHLDYPVEQKRPSYHKAIGLLCLAVFLLLLGKIWIPYAVATFNATAFTFLPAEWKQSYIEATLPKAALGQTQNRLTIATKEVHIEAPIIEGIDPTSLLKGVGHDPSSALPGSQGRVVLSGHRFWPDTSPFATVFFSLDKLAVGDSITLRYEDRDYRYKVTDRWDVPKDKAYPYLEPTTKPVLTIYTCGPTPYTARNRLGFNAILDETGLKDDAPEVMEALQEGIL